MRSALTLVAAIGIGSIGAIAAAPAAAQSTESPIEFIIGDQVVTRAEVRRPIDRESVQDPAKRRRLYESVRRNMAQEALLYQYARLHGIAISSGNIDRAVFLEQRDSPNGTIFAKGVAEKHGRLSQFREHIERRQTLGRLQARARYGPELSAMPPTAPVRIAFSRHRHTDLTGRWEATAASLAREAHGELYQVRFSLRALPGSVALATDFANKWRADTSVKVLRLLEEEKFPQNAVKFKPLVVFDNFTTTIFKPDEFPAAYRALSTIKVGQVSTPFRAGNFVYVVWLKKAPGTKAASSETVQRNVELSLETEAFAERLSVYVREALKTTYVWPESLRKDLLERHTSK